MFWRYTTTLFYSWCSRLSDILPFHYMASDVLSCLPVDAGVIYEMEGHLSLCINHTKLDGWDFPPLWLVVDYCFVSDK